MGDKAILGPIHERLDWAGAAPHSFAQPVIDAVWALTELHAHTWTDKYGRETGDPNEVGGKYGGGRCEQCGNVPVWCPTMLLITDKLGVSHG